MSIVPNGKSLSQTVDLGRLSSLLSKPTFMYPGVRVVCAAPARNKVLHDHTIASSPSRVEGQHGTRPSALSIRTPSDFAIEIANWAVRGVFLPLALNPMKNLGVITLFYRSTGARDYKSNAEIYNIPLRRSRCYYGPGKATRGYFTSLGL